MSNAWADWDLNTFTPILWWENSIFHLWYMHSTRHCMAFVHLEKAFHHVPWHVIWWALHKLGIEEWLVLLIQSLYENARSRVCFGCNLSEVLSVKVGVLQGFCLTPPYCFISGLEALTKEFHTGCPWENLYEDDLDQGFMSFRGLVKTSVLCVPRALA